MTHISCMGSTTQITINIIVDFMTFMYSYIYIYINVHHQPRLRYDPDGGLTRLNDPTTSLADGCSRLCKPCAGLHGNGQPPLPGKTPRIPSASLASDWPALLNAELAAAASLE